jgi:hypothetical protein
MGPHIDVSSLPDASQPEFNFEDTSFFQHHSLEQLPSPQHVMERVPGHRYGAVRFEDLGLLVKFSPELRFEEAQTMRAIKSAFPQGEIPVPEVFAWRSHQIYRFIYMELIEGTTLDDAWPSLVEEDKKNICLELRNIIVSLQQMTRDPTDDLIGDLASSIFLFLSNPSLMQYPHNRFYQAWKSSGQILPRWLRSRTIL